MNPVSAVRKQHGTLRRKKAPVETGAIRATRQPELFQRVRNGREGRVQLGTERSDDRDDGD